MKRAGARERTVNNNKSCMPTDNSWLPPRLMEKGGAPAGGVWAHDTIGFTNKGKRAPRKANKYKANKYFLEGLEFIIAYACFLSPVRVAGGSVSNFVKREI